MHNSHLFDNNEFENNKFEKNIQSIIDNYHKYPQYIIKYLTVRFPKETALIVINYIIKTKERRCLLMDCILDVYDIKLCDFDDKYLNGLCIDGCVCSSRECWKYLYKEFINLIRSDIEYFFSYNVNSSFIKLISKTDVIDDELFLIINSISQDPKYWFYVINCVKEAKLFSSDYGDIIFSIRDKILENDKISSDKKNIHIAKFSRSLLSSVLKMYNSFQKSISEITNNLYLSDISVPKNTSLMKSKKIAYVISLTKTPILKISNIDYTQIMIDDVGSEDFIKLTINTVDKVLNLLKTNKNTLVHCYRGLSRSVCFVILVLIHQGMTFKEAFDLIQSKRQIDPNPEFIRQIKEHYE